MKYAIVDIETTGGHADAHGITEIAIFVYDGTAVTDSFESLVNPGVPIPPFLEQYTGITNEMVADAPSFEDIAQQVYDMLHGCVFVAHNVNFDYSFVHYSLKVAGFTLDVPKLCTVRMSRKIFPGYKSYSLGNICAARGIRISDRHRAGGDARATVALFAQLLATDPAAVEGALKRGSKEYQLPPNLPKEQFDRLPQQSGIYYFHDDSGKVIYVGKAKNIKNRVGSHFSGNGTGKQKQDFLRSIFSISFTECATELMSLILEATEIQKHWPPFNRALKKVEFNFALYDYQDQNGYIRLAVERVRKHIVPLQTYRTQLDAIHALQQLVDTFELCPKLCLIHTGDAPCPGFCKGACELKENVLSYNNRVVDAIQTLTDGESYAVIDRGLYADEHSCVLVERGKFYGMGYIPVDADVHDIEQIKSYITPYKDSFYIREVIMSDMLRGNAQVVNLQPALEA